MELACKRKGKANCCVKAVLYLELSAVLRPLQEKKIILLCRREKAQILARKRRDKCSLRQPGHVIIVMITCWSRDAPARTIAVHARLGHNLSQVEEQRERERR